MNTSIQGRRIYHVVVFEKMKFIENYAVIGVKQLLTPGPVAHSEPASTGGFRQIDIIQIWSDPGGVRTLGAANCFYRESEAKKFLESG